MTLPNESDQFALYTDAYVVSVGAVLSVGRNCRLISRKLSPSEKKYSAIELECLAIIKVIDHLRWLLITKRTIDSLDLATAKHSFKTRYRQDLGDPLIRPIRVF